MAARVPLQQAMGSTSWSSSTSWGHLQRKSAGSRNAVSLHPAVGHTVDHALRSPGQSLDAATRAFMEPRFGHDLSQVRIHADQSASAQALDARAYALGRDIVFGRDRYAPHSAEGRRLLAHELTHVVQQSDSGAVSTQTPRLGAVEDALEAEADRAANSALRPAHAGVAPVRPVAGLSSVIQCDGPAQDLKPAPTTKHSGYPTAWQAAHAALERYNPLSIKSKDPKNIMSSGNEYGGLIYKTGDEYFFTEAVIGQGAGDESASVDPWKALDKIPQAARNSVVGDYHTHGAPPDPKRDLRERVKDPGEDFSGTHAEIHPLTKEVTTGTKEKKGDIYEVRQDLITYKANILNPETYTAFLATPTGRFTLFIPKKDLIFSFSPDPRLLPSDQKVQAASYAH